MNKDDGASPFGALRELIDSDPDYAWGWFCNLAVPIMDATNTTHEEANQATARKAARGAWYDGASFGSFDGILNYVDTRGALPQIKLTLSAGGKEIDGICNREDIDALGDVLDSRVRVYGRAIYASSSPLPLRIEVSSITPIKKDGDLTRWRGAFRPFAIEAWDFEAIIPFTNPLLSSEVRR